jgi:hypothetical protein
MIRRPTCGVLLLAVALLFPALSLAAEPEEAAVVAAEEIERTGKVIAINPESRLVVIEGEAGREIFLHAPEAAANFDKIKVGDVVTARFFEELAIAIAPVAGAEPGATAVAAVSLAPPGGTPSGVVAEQIELRAVVSAVDTETRIVTLDVPDGGQRTLKARDGIDLERVKVGEQVSVTYTRALALAVTPPAE